LLSQLDVFTRSARGRRDFVHAAGLGKVTAGMDWNGEVSAVAHDLLFVLESAGTLVENVHYLALGKLLVYWLAWPTIQPRDAAWLAGLIVQHSLVNDPEYLEKLSEQYNLPDPPAPEGQAPMAHLAILPPVIPPSFSVNPQIENWLAIERRLLEPDNTLNMNQLAGAIYCAQAVGRVEAPVNNVLGTGWLIAPNILLTVFHVLKTREFAEEGVVRFGHYLDAFGVQAPGQKLVKIDPSFYYTSPENELDYALVRLEEAPLEARKPKGDVGGQTMLDLLRHDKHRGYLVSSRQGVQRLMQIQMIQYSGCEDLRALLGHSLVVSAEAKNRIHYVADTMPCASGAPVFNPLWEVIGMQHAARPFSEAGDGTPEARGQGRYILNEGIPMSAILADLKRRTIDNSSVPLIGAVLETK
jgi:V8-like Glu-specific endopeptidase